MACSPTSAGRTARSAIMRPFPGPERWHIFPLTERLVKTASWRKYRPKRMCDASFPPGKLPSARPHSARTRPFSRQAGPPLPRGKHRGKQPAHAGEPPPRRKQRFSYSVLWKAAGRAGRKNRPGTLPPPALRKGRPPEAYRAFPRGKTPSAGTCRLSGTMLHGRSRFPAAQTMPTPPHTENIGESSPLIPGKPWGIARLAGKRRVFQGCALPCAPAGRCHTVPAVSYFCRRLRA